MRVNIIVTSCVRKFYTSCTLNSLYIGRMYTLCYLTKSIIIIRIQITYQDLYIYYYNIIKLLYYYILCYYYNI